VLGDPADAHAQEAANATMLFEQTGSRGSQGRSSSARAKNDGKVLGVT